MTTMKQFIIALAVLTGFTTCGEDENEVYIARYFAGETIMTVTTDADNKVFDFVNGKLYNTYTKRYNNLTVHIHGALSLCYEDEHTHVCYYVFRSRQGVLDFSKKTGIYAGFIE